MQENQPGTHPSIAPPAPGAATTVAQTPALPLSPHEVAEIRARRTELSNQLTSAEGRRNRLVEELEGTEGAVRAGLEERIVLLDKRIVQLEADIAETGRELTAAPGGLASSTGPVIFERLGAVDVTTISTVFTIFVLAPLAIAFARLLWKRAIAPVRAAPPEATRKLDHLEQAVDAIAIEVERISESQRYLTRILTEGGSHHAVGAGEHPAEPLRVPNAGAVRVPREET